MTSRNMELFLVVAILVSLPCYLMADCFATPTKIAKNAHDQEIKVCGYRGITWVSTGTKFRTEDCFECECTEIGLICCGFGLNQMRYDYVGLEHCNIVDKKCERYFVRKDDPTIDCLTGEQVQFKDSSMMDTSENIASNILSAIIKKNRK
ncbi:hypothetical protein CHS0354_016875 [Potamilus streckersoni]|uniref:Beta-microseminoprotein-like n=1 Tax=Potamilus streckersoni TaxID=2493646 RepID=A0AAE0S8R5_9BIVA|nr:hypothetical protein CHS0354_016875 [Potamilus streckersoni]